MQASWKNFENAHPRSGVVLRFRNSVIPHVLVEDVRQVVLPAADAVEVVHVDGPGHGAGVALRLDPFHLDLHALRVLVTHPLRACWARKNPMRARRMCRCVTVIRARSFIFRMVIARARLFVICLSIGHGGSFNGDTHPWLWKVWQGSVRVAMNDIVYLLNHIGLQVSRAEKYYEHFRQQ